MPEISSAEADLYEIRRAIAKRDRELRLLRAIDRVMTRYGATSLPVQFRRRVASPPACEANAEAAQ